MELAGKNYFELFALPVRFNVDIGAVGERYRELQRVVHPDQFVSGTEQEQRIALEQAALINDAYQTIKSPLKRAQYLLTLNGAPLDESDTRMDIGFLMEQMEMREMLEEIPNRADPFLALNTMADEIKQDIDKVILEVARLLDGDGDIAAAREPVKKMQFMFKVQQELDEMEERLGGQL